MATLSATEIAFLMVAFQQAVLAGGWWLSGLWFAGARGPLRWWAAYAVFSALGLALFVLAVLDGNNEHLRALGNVCVVASLICLQRGVWRFFGGSSLWWSHAAAMALTLAVSWFGMSQSWGPLRVAVISGVLAALSAATAWDVHRGTRRQFELRYGVLLALPLLLGAAVFGARSLRAIVSPQTIVAEVTANSVLNIGSAVVYMIVALVFQLTLVTLVVSRLVSELKRASRHDPLTGLLNRRAIDEALAAEVQRARRLGAPFSVLMLDVDRFKPINDTHGHAAGDRALQHLATLLSSQMRDIDRVGRYGGEEFVVLLPGTPQEQAHGLAQRLCEKVAALPPMWRDAPLPVTVSIGVAEWLGDSGGLPALMARADAALYRAKEDGRNRVVTTGHGGLDELGTAAVL
ncbi:MAG TPA: GGDEF domain-containing protein [Burkholderiaceae bacterium]